MAGLLDRDRTIAKPEFNRWLVPPAALAIHLAIGQAYAFSVFNFPMTKLIGVTMPRDVHEAIVAAPGDWTLPELSWIFSLAIVFLGLSAAVFGTWLERVGPRKAMFVAACCFGGGFLVAAAGIFTHIIWLVYIGYGVIGGIGLGLGYISPVSTLIKWFPDRPGMATGMAIMGFGGGAMIASPLSKFLMDHFQAASKNAQGVASSMGVGETFIVLGILYFIFMMWGVATVRLPAPGWKPANFVPSTVSTTLITIRNVTADRALATPQFYLLWFVLFLNVTAGIAVLSQASPMIQEMFPGRVSAKTAAGFVGLLSLFNMGGRFLWSSASDYIGRKWTYMIYFVLGAILYFLIPSFGKSGSIVFFVAAYAIILSMYGGGFSTIPAYLKDLFGTIQVGAIHGRILTAWSAAGIAGPVLISYLREYQIHHGVSSANAYSVTMYIMAGLLIVGFFCNLMVTRVNDRHYVEASDTPGNAGTDSGMAVPIPQPH